MLKHLVINTHVCVEAAAPSSPSQANVALQHLCCKYETASAHLRQKLRQTARTAELTSRQHSHWRPLQSTAEEHQCRLLAQLKVSGRDSSFTISVAKMRLRQRTSVKSFGKMRARQNSLHDSIHIGARCNQHRHYINVHLNCGNKQRWSKTIAHSPATRSAIINFSAASILQALARALTRSCL